MNTATSTPVRPPAVSLSVQFIVPPPVEIKITNPAETDMQKIANPKSSLTPSLFQVAASLDVPPSHSPAGRPAITLPLSNWTFSREKLERALASRFNELKKRTAVASASHVARQPFLRIQRTERRISGARPIQLAADAFDSAKAA